MPRIRRKALKQRTAYTSAHVFQLVVGHDFFRDAFGNDLDAMREAWPILRDRVMTRHAERQARGGGSLRPWAWWKFECPIPVQELRRQPNGPTLVITRKGPEPEADFLARHNLLTDEEGAGKALSCHVAGRKPTDGPTGRGKRGKGGNGVLTGSLGNR